MPRAQVYLCGEDGRQARLATTLPRANPKPACRLRRILAEQRDNGKDFKAAWPAAVAVAISGLGKDERLAWARAFDATRQEWEACWHRQGPALRLATPDD